jgi:uncharacterized BrkB/YihY/UPF0761 family membrane protein
METLAGLGLIATLVLLLLWLFIIIEFFYIGARVGRIAKNSDRILALLEKKS